MSYEDPFFVVKEEIEQNVSAATTLFESWNRIYNTVASINNEELQRTEEELRSTLNDVSADLDDTRQQLQDIRLTLADPPKKLKGSEIKNLQELMDGHQSFNTFDQIRSKSRYEEVIEMDNTKFINNETLQQTVLIREQDEQLESLYGTARNIHDIVTTMGTEIESQNILLDEFGERVDRTSGRLENAMKKTNDENLM
ncbi:601_t:CDS:2 [Acaulospora morrowiae]|uniref:601_t:CDS:1 n=1 Tax=Acaulospora morrowiae TaxID=94023 RepID=A0A9N8YY44_9GLOM|nr:601_t:CDS:2 [Acaulospora morrowiae]